MLSESAAVAEMLPDTFEDQRCEPRYGGIVERAVITFRGADYPVPVINLSSRGTQIECGISPRLGESLVIRFENCSRMQCFVRWAKDGKLGIRFGHEIILMN